MNCNFCEGRREDKEKLSKERGKKYSSLVRNAEKNVFFSGRST